MKVLVTGPYDSGKSTFIHTATAGTSLSIDKMGTTVALDHGICNVEGIRVVLFGCPGLERFQSMRQVLSKGSDAVIFVVDSVNKEKDIRARAIWTEVNRYLPKVPVIIVANKVDLKRARSVDQLRQELPFLSGMPVVPISAKTGYNVNNVVRAVVLLFIMEWSQLFQILSQNSGKKHAFTTTANMLGFGQKKTTQTLRWLESRSLIEVDWENQSFRIKNPVLNAVKKPALIFSKE